jgi:TetR/AcrR family transcriptional regulator, transcriptional repressor for nem operon
MTTRPLPATKSERTRRRIVRAAAREYRLHGIDGIGVRDIMKRAGLTQGGFYFHFPDKESLFEEASREAVVSLSN